MEKSILQSIDKYELNSEDQALSQPARRRMQVFDGLHDAILQKKAIFSLGHCVFLECFPPSEATASASASTSGPPEGYPVIINGRLYGALGKHGRDLICKGLDKFAKKREEPFLHEFEHEGKQYFMDLVYDHLTLCLAEER
jgi:hypothetical protein